MNENEKDNPNKYVEWMKNNINQFLSGLSETKKNILLTMEYGEFACETIDKVYWNGKNLEYNLEQLEQIPEIMNHELFTDQLKYLNQYITGMVDDASHIRIQANIAREEMKYLSGALSSSDLNMATGATGIYAYGELYQQSNPQVLYDLKNPKENPFNKRESLLDRLMVLNPSLPNKLKDIYQSASIVTKTKHIKNTANLMREFFIDFLDACAPNNEVNNMSWKELSERRGTPTHETRTIYMIIGSNQSFNKKTQSNRPILEIAKNYRRLYKKLSKYTHFKDKISKEAKLEIRTCFYQLIEYTEIILNLRDRFFNHILF